MSGVKTMSDRTGQCLCGAINFTATDVPDGFSTCYCKACQRWTGGPFKGVAVKAENLAITGRKNIGIFQSSDFAERSFCKKCGSAIWFRLTAGKYAGNTSIALGLLDNTDGLTARKVYFEDYKNSADTEPQDCQKFTSVEVEKMITDFVTGDAK